MLKKLQIILIGTGILFSGTVLSQNRNAALIPYRAGNVYGLSDTLGKVIVKPEFSDIKTFGYYFDKKAKTLSEARFVVKKTGKYFLIDHRNQPVIPQNNKYDSITIDKDDCRIAYVYSQGKTGVFFKNKEIIAPVYDKIEPEKNTSFKVIKEDKKGIFNSAGIPVVPIGNYAYLSYGDYEKGKIEWLARGSYGESLKHFYDVPVEIPQKENYISRYNDNYQFPFEKEIPDLQTKKRKVGSLYKTTAEYSFMKRYVEVGKDGLYTFYDFYLDKELFPLQYEKFNVMGADHNTILFSALKNRKYGLLNLDGKIILPVQYDEIIKNDDGAVLKKDGKYGLYILNTVYKPIEAKYTQAVKKYKSIPVSGSWQFSICKTGKDYIGENGIEYFKQ